MRRNKIVITLLILVLCLSAMPDFHSAAQSGVLIPSTMDKPNDTVLSLAVMNVDICVDNQFATVKVVQIFDNHTADTLEGKYLFALPLNGSVSDFAIWDNDARIPGVIMEKRRAEAVYGEIKQPTVDPGLLEQTDEHGGASAFSAKVFPINPYGTKRVEMEYTEMLPIQNLEGNLSSHLTFPLKSSDGAPLQRVGEFHLHLCLASDYPITPLVSDAFPLKINKQNANEFDADFAAENVELNKDFAFDYQINQPENMVSFITHRAPETISSYDLRDPAQAAINPDGYFEARTIFEPNNKTDNQPPRRVLLMLDTSLSMAGEKLAKAVAATDFFLHGLTERDEFNLVLFSDEARALSTVPLPATTENIENAVNFIKNSNLGGGTNLKKTLENAIELSKKFSSGERDLVLISDANPTLETTDFKKITAVFDNNQNENVKFYAFALGSDSNVSLLKDITEKTHGAFAQARETEDISAALKIFFAQIGQPTIENLAFKSSNEANFYQIYSTGANAFADSDFAFVGRYKQPETLTISISGQSDAAQLNLSREVNLPAFDDAHKHLPRLWARARVDALLQEINRSGEREDYISEIIRLSGKYKFVTPYTAFLAAPRALLRPRLIQPGDPVIRVKTDASIKSVFAVLPFGETLPLKFLATENVWETRFLAPAWMPDGTYACRLLLTDKNGNGYEERKTFVVDSHAPKIKINLAAQTVRSGDEITMKVSADGDTARLTAKLYGAQPVQLFWSNAEKANVGKLRVPANLTAGKYVLSVTAEDFAHNQST
ncbi:MAG: VIT domain-containing protein, partial [Pyrinomonadaceae bacterium]